MSDITIDVLHNRDKYPDDMEISLADGQKVKVGDWRAAVLPKGDFTRETEKWSRKEREYQAKEQELQQAQAALQRQLAEAMQSRTPPQPSRHDGQITDDDLLADPVLGPVMRRVAKAEEELKTYRESAESRFKQHEETWLRANYMAQLSKLGSQYNERFNADGKGKAFSAEEFVKYAHDNGVTNLDVAYKSYVLDDEVARATREAEARGEERGIKKGRVPAVPFGRRRGPTRPEGLPGSLQELTDDAVLDDPDIQSALRGDAEER